MIPNIPNLRDVSDLGPLPFIKLGANDEIAIIDFAASRLHLSLYGKFAKQFFDISSFQYASSRKVSCCVRQCKYPDSLSKEFVFRVLLIA